MTDNIFMHLGGRGGWGTGNGREGEGGIENSEKESHFIMGVLPGYG